MEELKRKHEKQVEELQKVQRAEVALLQDQITLGNMFHEVLIAHPQRLQRLMKRNKLCIKCDKNTNPANYAQKYVLDGQIYCDAHGKLKSEHIDAIHQEPTENCQECAIYDCPFLCETHDITDPSNCHECRLYA